MSKKKTIAVAVVLALVLIIGGMLAYFTDTDTATNVFTIGDNVDISLSETNWSTTDTNNNDVPDAAEGVHPGTKVVKDPTINNVSTTTPAYVFAEIVVPCYDADEDENGTADTPLFKLLGSTNDTVLGTSQGAAGNSGWILINTPSVDTGSKTITYVYAYGTSSAMTSLAANTSTTTPVFSKVQVDPDLTADQVASLSSSNIDVNVYGIQTDGLDVTAPADIFELF